MPNLKDIKSRIQSVQNTQKITKAMKMVAAAKVKRAESSVKESRRFSKQLLEKFNNMPQEKIYEQQKKKLMNHYTMLRKILKTLKLANG